MKRSSLFRRTAVATLLLLLIGLIACGPSEVATPTPTKAAGAPTATGALPTPTPASVLVPVLPTATRTPLPGVTATPTPTATPVPAAERPKYGGTVTVGTTGWGVFDQLQSAAGYGWSSLGLIGNLDSQLIRVSPKDRVTIEPDLAESWSVSADGTVWKFKIRPGVVDHAGNPYTVEDAYYQMVRYVERPNGLPGNRQTCIRTYVKKIWDANKQPVANGGAEITGPNELTIRLVGRRPAFAPCFAGIWTVFTPSKYTKRIDTDPSGKTRDLDFSKGEVISTGPFKVKDAQVDNFILMERFDKYFRPGLPYLDGLRINIIPEQSTLVAAFSVGKHELFIVTPTSISVADSKRVQAQLGDTVAFPRAFAMGYNNFNMNIRRPPFGPADSAAAKDLRTAVQLTIDRQEINDLVYEGIGHIATPYFVGWDWIYTEKQWLENFSGYDSTPAVKARDVAKAQKLMQDQGYGPNNRLKVQVIGGTGQEYQNVSLVVKNQLAKIYIDLSFVALQDSRPVFLKGDFDMGIDQVGAPFADPDSFNTSIFLPFEEGGRDYTGWIDPKWRSLLEKELSASDAERPAILRDMARVFYDDATRIGHIRPAGLQAYRTYIKGWVPAPYHSLGYTLENAWISK